jgi:hypothetical protein
MARPGFSSHLKFKRLVYILREPVPHVWGYLECLWEVAYANGDPSIGDSINVELAAQYPGEPGKLTAALHDVGLIDEIEAGKFQVHDLHENCPDYVRKRFVRDQSRKNKYAPRGRPKDADDGISPPNSGISPPNSGNGRLIAPNGAIRPHSLLPTPSPTPNTPQTPEGRERVCIYCGVKQSQVDWIFEADHFCPRSAGGQDESRNIVDACHVCNQIKKARIFSTLEEARDHIHRTLWVKNRSRYAAARKLCFGGVPHPAVAGGAGEVVAAGFSEFWEAYPRKVAKQATLKAWNKLQPDESLRAILLEALGRQKQSAQWTRDAGQYIPYPASWINGRRWEDQPALNGRVSGAAQFFSSEDDHDGTP